MKDSLSHSWSSRSCTSFADAVKGKTEAECAEDVDQAAAQVQKEVLEKEALEQEAPGQQDTQRVALLRDVRGTV